MKKKRILEVGLNLKTDKNKVLINLMNINQKKIKIKNHKIALRVLKSEDKKILGNFFIGLSERTKKWYSPHDFTQNRANLICKEIEYRKHKPIDKRVVAICNKEIIGYCILLFLWRKWDKIRYYNKYNMIVSNDDVCTIAPCISDDYQGIGLGGEIMDYIIQVAKQHNKKIIVLWGGVVVKNNRAVDYYRKNNFEITKKWLHPIKKVMSYDMYLRI